MKLALALFVFLAGFAAGAEASTILCVTSDGPYSYRAKGPANQPVKQGSMRLCRENSARPKSCKFAGCQKVAGEPRRVPSPRCQENPGAPGCRPTDGVACARTPFAPGCPQFCASYPASPRCTGRGSIRCEINPQTPGCPDYCANRPNSPRCR